MATGSIAAAATGAERDGDWPASSIAWYATSLMMLSYFLAYVDRSVINLLIEPIKRDLGLSDTEISFIVGSSFAIFFALAGIPLGRLADAASRKWVITVSAVAWSVMTALCGFARGFVPLFLCRVGVGVGEAGLNPSAMSLISDYFPRDKRQLAITCYIVAGTLGAGFAVVIGAGLLAIGEQLSASGFLMPGLRPWQWVFILVALPALPLALLIALTVREPDRRGVRDERVAGTAPIPWREVLGYYRERWRWMVPLLLGASIILTISVGYLVWGIPLVQRLYGLEAKQAALYLAFPMFLCGVAGNFISSHFGQHLMRRGHADGLMRAMLVISLIAMLPVTLAPLVTDLPLFVLVLAPFLGMLTAMAALPQIAIQLIVPNRLRGQTIGLFYLVINVVSYSVGPTSVALLTDYVFRDEAMLRFSLLTVSAVAFPVAVLLFLWGLPHFRAEVRAVGLASAPQV